MLAVRGPSMGSSKPPNLDMPFGYSFDAASNFPFPSPTAPAPGPSLLDDNETKYLESFFDGVTDDHFNYNFFDSAPDGSDVGLGWDELPPAFMGTSSSFGQQPQQLGQGHADMTFGEMAPPMNTNPAIAPSATTDVLAAATLLHNGGRRSQSMSDGAFRGQIPTPPTNGLGRTLSMSQQTASRTQPRYEQRFGSSGGEPSMQDNYFTDMVFGSDRLRQRGASQKVDIRWGSDAGFNSPQGFIPPVSQESIADNERAHISAVANALSFGQLPSSADTTRPSSPVFVRNDKTHKKTKSIGQDVDEEQDSRPRKRRKSKFPEDEDEELDSPVSATHKGTKKRKPVKKGSDDSQGDESDSGGKRRKSNAASAAKPSRENLTEDQKRENHIRSEQKRRTLIREGFADLGELVPGLRGGGFSKSAVLLMAADWLDDLIRGNDALSRQLATMEGR